MGSWAGEPRGRKAIAGLVVLSLLHLAAAYVCFVIGALAQYAENVEPTHLRSVQAQEVLAKTAGTILAFGAIPAWFGRWRLWVGGVAVVVALVLAFTLTGVTRAGS